MRLMDLRKALDQVRPRAMHLTVPHPSPAFRGRVVRAGTPQGATASSWLADDHLHYVFDFWAQQWRRRHATGDMIFARYADDVVLGFEHQTEATRNRRRA